MHVSIIVATGKSGQIGRNNQIPWHVSEDLKHFRRMTMGHHLLMGRKTFESIGRPLPGRTSIVVSRQKPEDSNGSFWVTSIEKGIQFARNAKENELFIIGGAEIYSQALPYADCVYNSVIDYDGPADSFFSRLDEKTWKLIAEQPFGPTSSPNVHWFKTYYRQRG